MSVKLTRETNEIILSSLTLDENCRWIIYKKYNASFRKLVYDAMHGDLMLISNLEPYIAMLFQFANCVLFVVEVQPDTRIRDVTLYKRSEIPRLISLYFNPMIEIEKEERISKVLSAYPYAAIMCNEKAMNNHKIEVTAVAWSAVRDHSDYDELRSDPHHIRENSFKHDDREETYLLTIEVSFLMFIGLWDGCIQMVRISLPTDVMPNRYRTLEAWRVAFSGVNTPLAHGVMKCIAEI